MRAGRLVCPSCGSSRGGGERFCDDCGMPLVPEGEQVLAADERRVRARKIEPRYAEGELVRVAGGRNQAEAELIQGILLEEGIPSMLRRTRGFDVPEMLAAGPRDVMVPAGGASAARDALLLADIPVAPARVEVVAPARLLAGIVAALTLVALIAWIGVGIA